MARAFNKRCSRLRVHSMRTVSRASPCAQGTSVRVSGLDTKKIVSNLMVNQGFEGEFRKYRTWVQCRK